MGHFPLVDAMYRDGFQCSVCGLIMGETAELLGRDYAITREQSDAYAVTSQQRAEAAINAGHFTAELAPVTVASTRLVASWSGSSSSTSHSWRRASR